MRGFRNRVVIGIVLLALSLLFVVQPLQAKWYRSGNETHLVNVEKVCPDGIHVTVAFDGDNPAEEDLQTVIYGVGKQSGEAVDDPGGSPPPKYLAAGAVTLKQESPLFIPDLNVTVTYYASAVIPWNNIGDLLKANSISVFLDVNGGTLFIENTRLDFCGQVLDETILASVKINDVKVVTKPGQPTQVVVEFGNQGNSLLEGATLYCTLQDRTQARSGAQVPLTCELFVAGNPLPVASGILIVRIP